MASLIASEREARRQQRLRGAQRHQIPDVDFGLSFPAFPATSQQSNREKTPPEADLNPQLPAKQTPRASVERNTPLTRSKRKTPEISNDEQDEPDSVKRRRLDDEVPSSNRSSRSQSRRDIYELEEDEPDQDVLQELNAASFEAEAIQDADVASEPRATNSKTSSQDGMPDEEVDESPSSAPGSGRRRHSLRSRLSNSQDSESLVVEIPQLQKTSSPSKTQKTVQSKPSARRGHDSTPTPQQYDERDELDEISPEQPSTVHHRPLRRLREQFSDDLGEGDEAEEINDREAARYMEKNRRRDVPDEDSLEIDELEASVDVSGLTNTPTPNPTNHVEELRKAGRPKTLSKASPSAQRQPKPKARKAKGSGGVKRPRGDPIPVTVYRLTKAPNYDEEADEADILISNVPYFKRAGANAVDVLSQVAEELIETGLSTLKDGASNADARTRREWMVKLRALTHYQQEIRPRLLELSSNLDHGYSIARRIRIAQKERMELREEIMRIRREREQIALRMDEIRIQQEEDNKNFLARNEINNAFHDIENAVERGKAMPEEEDSSSGLDTAGLEMLLKSVAAEVSSASDEGGVLKQVKEFNAFLERAALALEGRV